MHAPEATGALPASAGRGGLPHPGWHPYKQAADGPIRGVGREKGNRMIVVTGGAGFIGSNLVAALAARGRHDLVVCDHLGAEDKWRNLAKRELHDLIPPSDLLAWLEAAGDKVDMLVHLGAISATSAVDGDEVVATNFHLPTRLWRWSARHRVRLIYASSAATYGDGSQGFDDDSSLEALARLRPLNLYGWSKHLFDRWVQRAIAGGAPAPPQWVGLKFFNVYGPNEYHKGDMRSAIAKQVDAVRAGQPMRLFASDRPDIGHGQQRRDFVWVGDAVDAMLWLLDQPKVNGLFNLGSGKARSWNDLAYAVAAACGRESLIEYVPPPAQVRGHYQYFTEAPMQRLRRAGYETPFTSLEDGVRRYVQDYLLMPDPYA